MAKGFERFSERPDGARDQNAFARRLACDADALAIDLCDLTIEAVGPELEPVRAGSIRLDELSARIDIFLMHLLDQGRRREI